MTGVGPFLYGGAAVAGIDVHICMALRCVCVPVLPVHFPPLSGRLHLGIKGLALGHAAACVDSLVEGVGVLGLRRGGVWSDECMA